MTSSEYKTSVGNVFDTACDELGMDLALAMQMAATLERIERRGYHENEAMRFIVERLKDASLDRVIASISSGQSLKADRERIASLESALQEIEGIAASV